MISGEKILVTGVSGTVAGPLARSLAADNEVWGLARFADGTARQELEDAGITTHAVDLGTDDLAGLPDDFTYVLHLAWTRADLSELEMSLRTNVEGAGLVLEHCRRAKAALVMSGMGIYSPAADPWHAYSERDPIGRAATAYAPTSPASKLGLEAVARFCARAFDLPVTITRLNTFMGPPASFPGMHIGAVLAGRPMVAPCDPTPHNPIHVDDMAWQVEPLLDAAEHQGVHRELVRRRRHHRAGVDAASLGVVGSTGHARDPGGALQPTGALADATRRRELTGPCRTRFEDSFRSLYDTMTAG